MIVVDASAMTEFLLQTPVGGRVEARLFRDGDEFHAPHLIDVEIAQALRRLVRTGAVPPERAEEAIADLTDFDLRRYPHVDLSHVGAAGQPHVVRRDVRCARGGDRQPGS